MISPTKELILRTDCVLSIIILICSQCYSQSNIIAGMSVDMYTHDDPLLKMKVIVPFVHKCTCGAVNLQEMVQGSVLDRC